jgi:catechol 2,3-dioxygenase-like lactoylglutathione lyase family enzyme
LRIKGLAFVGTRTVARETMTRFVQDVLGLTPTDASGIDADLFALPDGSMLAIAPTDEPNGERTVGFLVEDLDAACAELRAADIEVDSIAANERFRYMHFRAPDGKLYELVEPRSD